ncbi:two-component regulator propeller domain-containing protein [Colwellia piezophila]|uniref:two-component regulator propeller domain-containing protein n=1 Tax=Colwellia piezophila TaxID=211668 RepID=UPI0003694EE7|nr:two-component regulator propeller domain-containing protein [Colwellia piezophila]
MNKFNALQNNFQRIPLDNSDNASSLYLRDLVEGNEDELWIATRDNGVIKLNERSQQVTSYKNSATNNNTLSSNVIQSLLFDENNQKLWIGTWGGGLNSLDITNNKFKRFYQDSGAQQKNGPQTIVSIMKNQQSTFWLGTLNGVAYFDFST